VLIVAGLASWTVLAAVVWLLVGWIAS